MLQRIPPLNIIYIVIVAPIFVNSNGSDTKSNDNATLSHTPRAYQEELLLKKFLLNQANCALTQWECNTNCRVEFRNINTGLCRRPTHGDSCFGIPIRYNYTKSDRLVAALPLLEILSRFPRCWASLGPLICAVAYRPCSNRSYIELSMNAPSAMEMWQVYSKKDCLKAMNECNFVVQLGLWPDFIDCSISTDEEGPHVFAESDCQIAYNKEPAHLNRRGCIWPLVWNAEGNIGAKAVIDECYIPCRSPLLSSSWIYNQFKLFVLMYSLLITLLSLLFLVYIVIFSFLWTNSFCVYALTSALFCAFIYWSFWLSGYFDVFSQNTMCIGKLRRLGDPRFKILMDWCHFESWFMHFSILAGFFWIMSFEVIRIGRLRSQKNCSFIFGGNSVVISHCFLLSTVVYVSAALFATLGTWNDAMETDGLFGVCYVGLKAFRKGLYVYVPLIVGLIASSILCCIFVFCRSESKQFKGLCTHSITRPVCGDFTKGDRNLMSSLEKTDYDYSIISHTWLGVLYLVTLVSILLSSAIHVLHNMDEDESLLIFESIRCSLNRTMTMGDFDWFKSLEDYEQFPTITDALDRRQIITNRSLAAPGCALNTINDRRLLFVIVTFVIFPSLPFLCVLIFMILGFFGYGMRHINRLRTNLSPFIRSKCPEANNRTSYGQAEGDYELLNIPVRGKIRRICETSIYDPSCELNSCIDESGNYQSSCGKIIKLNLEDSSVREERKQATENSERAPCNSAKSTLHEANKLYSSNIPVSSIQSGFIDASSNHGRDSDISAAVFAYQNGLMEGQWRERCNQYLSQILTLTDNLKLADKELKRLKAISPHETMLNIESKNKNRRSRASRTDNNADRFKRVGMSIKTDFDDLSDSAAIDESSNAFVSDEEDSEEERLCTLQPSQASTSCAMSSDAWRKMIFSGKDQIITRLRLTAEQQKELYQLRSSVTATDMLNLSQHFLVLAERIESRDLKKSSADERQHLDPVIEEHDASDGDSNSHSEPNS